MFDTNWPHYTDYLSFVDKSCFEFGTTADRFFQIHSDLRGIVHRIYFVRIWNQLAELLGEHVAWIMINGEAHTPHFEKDTGREIIDSSVNLKQIRQKYIQKIFFTSPLLSKYFFYAVTFVILVCVVYFAGPFLLAAFNR